MSSLINFFHIHHSFFYGHMTIIVYNTLLVLSI
nr:MAG TPA: hypothetical protein [Caudoviricetes sp.]